MKQTVTIRFSHIDGAGIVFYPRYFELLSELFDDVPCSAAPFAMQTDFMKPNYLGDELDIEFAGGDDWSFTGRMNDTAHFSIRALEPGHAPLTERGHRPERDAFRTRPMTIAPWTTDCTGYLQTSRYFELVNFSVEQWFAGTLGTTFRELHSVHGAGIPTVWMRTVCRELPCAGDTTVMWIRPDTIGGKSLTYTSWLTRGDTCLLQTEQTIVFVKPEAGGFRTIRIPDGIRQRLERQHVAA